MKKKINLKNDIKILLKKNLFYLKHNRNLQINFEENYHSLVRDPDGKLRNL